MKPKGRQSTVVRAWSFGDLLLELYCYAPGSAESIPKHFHEEYQFCLKLDFSYGEYHYRGVRYHLPVGSLCIFHPGEMHSSYVGHRRSPVKYCMMYMRPALLQTIAAEIAGHKTELPFWKNPIINDKSLARLFLKFYVNFETDPLRLEQESLLLSMLTRLIQQYSATRFSVRPIGIERKSVRRVCEYLQDNYAENVSLNYLAQIANLSPYHLHRVFRHEMGLPPHQYQIQVRIARARALLARGMPISRVAFKTGFSDQSHLTRYFKRIVKVTPGRYIPQNNKNIQDITGLGSYDLMPA